MSDKPNGHYLDDTCSWLGDVSTSKASTFYHAVLLGLLLVRTTKTTIADSMFQHLTFLHGQDI